MQRATRNDTGRWLVHRLWLALALMLIPFAAAPTRAQTAQTGGVLNTVLILDASNSMKGRIPGDTAPKFVLMRNAVLKALAPGRFKGQLGIVSFGSRRPADCQDVAQLMPLGAPEAERAAAALERFQPIGYSPVFPALREAARTLGPGHPATIVLVLDDLASCREDPCAAAADLKRDYPDITVNIVGLALRPEDSARLACVARQTGGRLFDPQDAASFGSAFDQAVAAAAQAAPPRPAPPAAATPAPDKPVPGLHLAVALDARSGPIEVRVRYEVRRADAAGGPPLIDATTPALDADIEPGRYRVRITAGLAQTTVDVEVGAEAAVPRTVALDAGLLTVLAPHAKTAAGSPTATIAIAAQSAGTTAPTLLSGAVADLIVPAGAWTITATDGLARATRTITVTSGARLDAELPLMAGRLTLDPGRNSSGDILWLVTEDDPDSPGGRREIARSLAPSPQFVLPAGTYTIFARTAGGELRDTLTLRPGDEITRNLAVQTARLALAVRFQGTAPLPVPGNPTADADLPLSWRILRADDGRQVAAATEPTPAFDLAAGRYHIEARIGAQNALLVRDVEVRAGADQRLQFEVPAGRIRLRTPDTSGGLVLADVYWEITDDRGRTVWRTGLPQPALVLVAGRYRVRLEWRNRVTDAAFEVRAGDNRTIELTPG